MKGAIFNIFLWELDKFFCAESTFPKFISFRFLDYNEGLSWLRILFGSLGKITRQLADAKNWINKT